MTWKLSEIFLSEPKSLPPPNDDCEVQQVAFTFEDEAGKCSYPCLTVPIGMTLEDFTIAVSDFRNMLRDGPPSFELEELEEDDEEE